MPKSVSGEELLPRSSLLTVTTVERNEVGWTVVATGTNQASCPRCRYVSTSRHSRYVRSLTDLPAVGAVAARVCRSLALPAARVRGSLFHWRLAGRRGRLSRRTDRADVVTHAIGDALGGRPGERLSGRLGLPISDDTNFAPGEAACRTAFIS
jgi:hypothetical protein